MFILASLQKKMYKNEETTDNCDIKEKCHKNRKRKIWFNFLTPFLHLRRILISVIGDKRKQTNDGTNKKKGSVN